MASDSVLKRLHARRLREVYRSAGWPSLDVVEIELLAAGLLERQSLNGHDHVRVTDAGIQYLASAAQRNRQVMSAHDALVDHVARVMLRDGRLVWKNLSLRAWVAPDGGNTRTLEDGHARCVFDPEQQRAGVSGTDRA